MSEVSQETLTRLKGKYTEKYAQPMDDWTAIILHEIHENIFELTQHNSEKLGENYQQLLTTTQLIKGQLRTVQFKDNKQAFLYGLGQYSLFGLIAFLILLIGFGVFYTNSTFKEKWEFVQKYPSVEKFENVYQNAQTISKDGLEYMVAYPTKNKKVEFATEYIYEHENKRILIPIRAK